MNTSRDDLLDKEPIGAMKPNKHQTAFSQQSLRTKERKRFHDHLDDDEESGCKCDCWSCTSKCMTIWACSCLLDRCGIKTNPVQQAWREKMALVIIIFIACVAVGFLTFGFTTVVCNEDDNYFPSDVVATKTEGATRWYIIKGDIWNIPEAYKPYDHPSSPSDPFPALAGKDISVFFPDTTDCFIAGFPVSFKCKNPAYPFDHCHSPSIIGVGKGMDYMGKVAFSWKDVRDTNRFVINGEVYDAGIYIDQIPLDSLNRPLGDKVDQMIRESIGKDGTKAFSTLPKSTLKCVRALFYIGRLDVKNIGCLATDIVLYISLVVILAIVLLKFFLALVYAWFMGVHLKNVKKMDIAEQEQDNGQRGSRFAHALNRNPMIRTNTQNTFNSYNSFNKKLNSTNSNKMYTVLLVTCYSEDEVGLRTTLDSLTAMKYDDSQKLLFIIADGLITGSGNGKSTPEILIDLIELDPRADYPPQAHSYVALADGKKRNNMAQVYAGHYLSQGHRVPVILVVKCGTMAEAKNPKPGNRGKRDSQIILMSFFSKVIFDDRMTPLDYEMFRRIHMLTGVTPDVFELVLMVDADTKVDEFALRNMVEVMRSDENIMGMCGETQIANKSTSWVTMIQVFEYYVSHHLSKAFESVFGGVTCLPGCFCMYRIKAPKGKTGFWVPILANPDIIDTYSENVTDTLHKKNLLLLGEDRYLTTLMLKTFPKRKLIFVPHATCETLVPDEFKVLLSQRRRWINSTVHNLFELVLVNDLCGTFCCSMQFVIGIELIGTIVLPAAIIFTFVLVISAFVFEPQIIPLALLAAILGLPAILIMFTTRKFSYVGWMLIYILSLPVWNFVLPVYAYWHFDDFSWGETRKVVGSVDDDHGTSEGKFDTSVITMKRWHEYEMERLRTD